MQKCCNSTFKTFDCCITSQTIGKLNKTGFTYWTIKIVPGVTLRAIYLLITQSTMRKRIFAKFTSNFSIIMILTSNTFGKALTHRRTQISNQIIGSIFNIWIKLLTITNSLNVIFRSCTFNYLNNYLLEFINRKQKDNHSNDNDLLDFCKDIMLNIWSLWYSMIALEHHWHLYPIGGL